MTWPFRSSLARTQAYQDWFVFRPAAAATGDKTRFVKLYTPSTGKADVDNTYTNAIANGEAYELHQAVEPYTDIRQMVNTVLALPDCKVVRELSFVPASNTATRHSLTSAAAWLTDPDWVYQVGSLTTTLPRSDNDPFRTPIRGRAFKDAGTVYLSGFSRATTETVYVTAVAPAYVLCRASGGAFGDQSGLSATETDEAIPDESWIAWGVEMLYREQLAKTASAADRALAQQELLRAVSNWRASCQANISDPVRTFLPLRTWGPSSYTGWTRR